MYKNKPKKSSETMEEEGSATLVKGREFEMKANGIDDYDEEANLKNRSLSKGHSLPKPLVNRLYSMPTKIIKTLSLSSCELDSAWALGRGESFENGDQKSAHP